ncbi:MAG: putative sugar nucleotidyl transferase [Candidatus Zixiibacteriota bacterium]
MDKKVYLFDIKDATLFNPIAETRPVFNLLCGIYSYFNRIEQSSKIEKVDGLIVRQKLIEITRAAYQAQEVNRIAKADKTIFINGLAALSESDLARILDTQEKVIFHNGEDIIAMIVDYEDICEIADAQDSCEFYLDDLELLEFGQHLEMDIRIPKGIWDLPLMTGAQIIDDFLDLLSNNKRIKTLKDNSFDNYEIRVVVPERIVLGSNVKIEPFVLLDATDGPIIIGDNAEISAGSQLRGPLYIGNDCKIVNARISGGCSFGPVSRMGGEIEQSIVQGYSNKYHDGFLGHSYLGKWVNLGAMTTNSDLKNNYGDIKYGISETEVFNTGSMKVGAFLGDHAKTGIGTLINSGTNIGVGCNLYGGGMGPKYLKPFSWGSGSDGFVEYKIDKAIETAEKVASRRNLKLHDAEINLLREIHRKYWS